MRNKIQIYLQHGNVDCGLACLQMIASFYGKKEFIAELEVIGNKIYTGLSILQLEELAIKANFSTAIVSIKYEELQRNNIFPCIAYWQDYHYVVIISVSKDVVEIIDPLYGQISLTEITFKDGWISKKTNKPDLGILLYIGLN